MRAILVPTPGDASALVLADVPDPVPAPGEVLIEVAAAGVNRADVNQREGHYPSPPGSPEWPGLEVSGIVAGLGDGVTAFAVGDRVCALLGGGGYAEKVTVPVGQVLTVPESVDLVEAAGLIEVAATVWSMVFRTGGLRKGELLLVHGGSSGIGTMAIQLAREAGARVAVTAGSADKLAVCASLGAEILIDYRNDDFALRMSAEGGADVILDVVGGPYLERNVQALARDGRIVNLGALGGMAGTLDFGALMRKRGSVTAASLRARDSADKASVVAGVARDVWPAVAAGVVRPIIHGRFPFEEAGDAHRLMESSAHIGKILLVP
jgi:putative PIG3 family NAD(P)H quinone oxidoreductase